VTTRLDDGQVEADRLAALRRYNVLDTAAEEQFDEIVKLAAAICGAPISLISLIDEDRQWFKARVGLEATYTARDISACQYAILQPDLTIIPDTHEDARFIGNPLVTGENVLVALAFLQSFGFEADVASNGFEAYERAKTGRYAAVVMDVQMHGMNGLEAPRLIRSWQARTGAAHLPIIGMTAHALSGDRERCLEAGMDEYISKPFNPRQLEALLMQATRA
jgi:CheY-like chemotaxis protein